MEVEEVELTIPVSDTPERAPEAEPNLAVEEVQRTPSAVNVPVNVGLRRTAIARYLNSATNNAYQEYEDVAKGITYVVLIVLCLLVVLGWYYAHPGTEMGLKWKRSARRLKRLSKNFNSSFKGSWGIYPFLYDVVHAAYTVMSHFAD